MLDADEVIQRLCELQEKVWTQAIDPCSPADCFCGKGGYWKSDDSYGGTYAEGYRNDGKALEFIEQAVEEKLAAMAALEKDDE